MADNEHPDIKAALDGITSVPSVQPTMQAHLLDEAGRCTGWWAGYETALREESGAPLAVPQPILDYVHRQIGRSVMEHGTEGWRDAADPSLIAAADALLAAKRAAQ